MYSFNPSNYFDHSNVFTIFDHFYTLDCIDQLVSPFLNRLSYVSNESPVDLDALNIKISTTDAEEVDQKVLEQWSSSTDFDAAKRLFVQNDRCVIYSYATSSFKIVKCGLVVSQFVSVYKPWYPCYYCPWYRLQCCCENSRTPSCFSSTTFNNLFVEDSFLSFPIGSISGCLAACRATTSCKVILCTQ